MEFISYLQRCLDNRSITAAHQVEEGEGRSVPWQPQPPFLIGVIVDEGTQASSICASSGQSQQLSPLRCALIGRHCHPEKATPSSKSRDGAHKASSTVTPLLLNVSGCFVFFSLSLFPSLQHFVSVCLCVCFSSCVSMALQSWSSWKLDHYRPQTMKSGWLDENVIWSFLQPAPLAAFPSSSFAK